MDVGVDGIKHRACLYMPWGMAVEGLKPQSLLEGVPLHAMGDGCKGLESTEFACGGGAFKCHNACLYMP